MFFISSCNVNTYLAKSMQTKSLYTINMNPNSNVPPIRLLFKAFIGFFTVFVFILLCGYLFRPQLEAWANTFIQLFGLPGIALGSLLADGLHFPIPPQFYMAAAVINGGPQLPPLIAICIGCLLGGWVAFLTARYFARFHIIQRWLIKLKPHFELLFFRYGNFALILSGFLPLPYSTLCNLLGLFHIPRRKFFFFLLLRIPRLLLFYFVIRAGWMTST
jgi:membrane protein YqaA with SNARE-associated domain